MLINNLSYLEVAETDIFGGDDISERIARYSKRGIELIVSLDGNLANAEAVASALSPVGDSVLAETVTETYATDGYAYASSISTSAVD